LQQYRREFRPQRDGDRPWSAMSVLAFASDDRDAVYEFEAGWALTMQNLARNIREPLRPEEVVEYARSEAFRARRQDRDSRMVTGEASDVVARLAEMRQLAEVDEVVVVTPSLDRKRRIGSYREIAAAWRAMS
ncbi:MAG TPA: LLM class flavin-dependent oxidoreductase, partial [Nocardioidaceae bacterium]